MRAMKKTKVLYMLSKCADHDSHRGVAECRFHLHAISYLASPAVLTFLYEILQSIGSRHCAVVIKDIEFAHANGPVVLYPLPQVFILVFHTETYG